MRRRTGIGSCRNRRGLRLRLGRVTRIVRMRGWVLGLRRWSVGCRRWRFRGRGVLGSGDAGRCCGSCCIIWRFAGGL